VRKVIPRDGRKHPAVSRQEPQASRRHTEHLRPAVIGILAPLNDMLLDKLCELSPQGRARANSQQLQLLERDGLAALLGVSDLDDDVEFNQ